MAKKASASKTNAPKKAQSATPSGAEQIGFHKGSIMTLSKERAELIRILGIVEQLMQMHASALQELGVKLDGEMQTAVAPQQPAQKPKKPPIEDIL
jgi:hypothetical protein